VSMRVERMKELITRSFDCYRTADRAAMEKLLHADFTFTSPYDDHIGRRAYFERCWSGAGSFEYHDLKQFSPADGECFVLYEAKSTAGDYFRNVERFTFADDQIRSVEVFFGLPPHAKPIGPKLNRA
jgi:ketosteroid isomerase-like protein